MLNVSAEWQRSVMLDNNRQYIGYADIVTADNEKISTDNSNYWEGGFTLEDATSNSDSFTVGALVSSKLTLKLNNIYDDYSKYDFTNATVTAYIGKQLSSGIEKVKLGEFTVNETDYSGSVITLSCLDNANKFNKAYDSTLSYPNTLYEIVRDACSKCGVPFSMAKFDNSSFTVSERPDSQNTYGQVLAYAFQICGAWGKCGHEGELTVGWYDMSQLEGKNYHGGTFSTTTTPYSDGDTLNGGNFTDYSSGDSVSGGTFNDTLNFHNLYGASELNIATDDVVITGVKITITSNTSDEEDFEYLAGKSGYVVSITDNPLVTKDNAKSVADFIYKKLGGMRFRPMSGSFLSNPVVESGDVAIITDRKQNAYNSFISSRTFSIGSYTSLSCDAESPARNSADRYSSDTKAIVEARKVTKTQLSAYDSQMQMLTQLMAQSFGLFKTEQKQSDGSTIYIMHNKSDLKSSQIQWKMTANGMAVSSDYGKTWNAGIDKDGNAIVNIMSAIGINFDWAHGGTLILGGENNTNGKQYVKDANGNILITLDNKGITLASGVKISWDNISNQPSIPTNTSDLNNDSDFATTGDIPTKVSELTNDSKYTTMSDVEKKNYTTMTDVEKKNYTTMQAVLDKKYQDSDQVTQITKNTVTSSFISTLGLLVGKEIQMGENATISWNNVTNQPSIPSKTSELTNDSDYVTQDDMNDYVKFNATNPLSELKNNIGYTEISGQYVITPTIYAGTVNSSTFNGCVYTAEGTATYTPNMYTTADKTRANNIILGKVTPTSDDYQKLDINGDGRISIVDITLIDRLLTGKDSKREYKRKVVIDPSKNGTIYFYENDELASYIAPKGINTNSITTNYLLTHGTVEFANPNDWSQSLFTLTSSGVYVKNMTATNSTISSDSRLKENIKEIPQKYYDCISEIELVEYNYVSRVDNQKKINFGIVAQELIQKFKKYNCNNNLGIISTHKEPFDNSGNTYYGVDYIQFLLLRLAGDEKKIKSLENKVEDLESKLLKLYKKLGIESEV